MDYKAHFIYVYTHNMYCNTTPYAQADPKVGLNACYSCPTDIYVTCDRCPLNINEYKTNYCINDTERRVAWLKENVSEEELFEMSL